MLLDKEMRNLLSHLISHVCSANQLSYQTWKSYAQVMTDARLSKAICSDPQLNKIIFAQSNHFENMFKAHFPKSAGPKDMPGKILLSPVNF